MKNKNLLSNYIQGVKSEVELDEMTKILVKDYFEESETKEKWKKILVEKYGINSFEDLNDWEEIKQKKPKTKLFRLSILSTLVASLLIFLIFTLNTETKTSDPLANILEEYNSNPIQYRNTKGEGDIEGNRRLAFESYNNKDYQSSAEILEKIISNDAFNEDDNFYLALSYLYEKKAEKSVILFKKILDQENLQRRDASTWFLALSLIENEQYSEARIYLNDIAKWKGNSGKTRKADQAKELLSIIKDL